MKKIFLPPLLIIGYNRPKKIAKLLSRIEQVKRLNKVYIKLDGPKSIKDQKKIKKIFEIIKKFKKNKRFYIKTFYEKKNIGLQSNIFTGVNWVFKFEKKIIVLEDDNIPKNTFFDFCEKMLNYYEKDKRIMHISGTCFLDDGYQDDDYYFSKFMDVVGWATWKSSWKRNIKSINLKNILVKNKLRKYNSLKYSDKWFFEYIYREVTSDKSEGLWSTWRYLTIILNNGLSISPKKNLVYHDGYYKKDNPVHFNEKIFLKNTFRLRDININKLKKKDILYNKKYSMYDKFFFNIIKKTDPTFNIIKYIRLIFRYYMIKHNFLNLSIKRF